MPIGFHRGKASPTHRREEIRRGEGVPPRKFFTGGKHRRPPTAGEKSRRGEGVPPRKVFTGGKHRRPSVAGEKSRRGERAAKKPRRWAGLSGWFGIMRSFGAGHALPEQPRTSCILWRTSSRMWSRAGVRY